MKAKAQFDQRLLFALAIVVVAAASILVSSNSSFSSPFTIQGFAVKDSDLSVESLKVGIENPSEFQAVPIEAVVKYSGASLASPKFVLRFNVSGIYHDFELPSKVASSKPTNSYPKISTDGKKYKVTILSHKLRKGSHFVSVSVDISKMVSEKNEKNNYAAKYFEVK